MPEFMNLLESWNGYVPVGRKTFSEAAIAGALGLLSNSKGLPHHRHEYEMREAVTTSDFPDLFGFILERDILARYKMWVADWRTFCATGRLPNFNTARLHKVQGNDTRLPRVAEKGEYLVSPMSDAYYSRAVEKYGRQFDISWESLVNDALGAMGDIAQRFADAAIRTEAFQVTSLFVDATGPNVLLFGAAFVDVDGGVVANLGNLPLTIANLETTLELMSAQLDVNGEPIAVRGMHLVVPPPLEFTARQILTSAQMQWTEVGAGGGIPVPTTNVMSQLGTQLHVDPYIQIVDATATDDTTWYLFAEPAQGKAMQMDFLTGYESPEICMKSSDKVTTAGGPLSPFSGDFATDNVFYRVRHVLGGIQLDPRFAYAQVGP